MDIEQIRADREAGTPGPWMDWLGEIGTEDFCVVNGDDVFGEANARRIARVPDLEAAVIAQDALIKELVEALEASEAAWETTSVSNGAIRAAREKITIVKAKAAQ